MNGSEVALRIHAINRLLSELISDATEEYEHGMTDREYVLGVIHRARAAYAELSGYQKSG